MRTVGLSFWASLPADIVPDGDALGRPLLLEGGVGEYHVLLDPLPLQVEQGMTIQIYWICDLQESGRSWQISPCSLSDTRQPGRFYWRWRAPQSEVDPPVLEEKIIRISRLCWEKKGQWGQSVILRERLLTPGQCRSRCGWIWAARRWSLSL